MNSEEKARKLADRLRELVEGIERAETRDPALAETLSPQEVRVLKTVGQMDCPIMSKIAGAIRLSLSTCTGLVDRLCEKRLVKRDRSADDRRVVQVELTDEGRRLHESAARGRVAFAKELLGSLDAKEQEELLALITKATEKLETKA